MRDVLSVRWFLHGYSGAGNPVDTDADTDPDTEGDGRGAKAQNIVCLASWVTASALTMTATIRAGTSTIRVGIGGVEKKRVSW